MLTRYKGQLKLKLKGLRDRQAINDAQSEGCSGEWLWRARDHVDHRFDNKGLAIGFVEKPRSLGKLLRSDLLHAGHDVNFTGGHRFLM
jgi:hypothetical protein